MNMEKPNSSCSICGEPIEEQRVAMGLNTCLKCAKTNPEKNSLGVDSSGKIYKTDLGENLKDLNEQEKGPESEK